MSRSGYLGIDAGTQGLSIVFADESLKVIAVGDGHYEMVPDLDEGCYEQDPNAWISAMSTAMDDLRGKLGQPFEVLSIGISGQMHGEVLVDAGGQSLQPARLWCDARNEAEGVELTGRLGAKMPKRITTARWLWTIRSRPEVAAKVKKITTPGGWISAQLTGEWNLGIGDAAGMFPIDQSTFDYDQKLLTLFDEMSGSETKLQTMLPVVRRAGEDAGKLSESGARLLGLPAGIPVAAAEGDQPAALAGSLIGAAGCVSMSFGTSVCANCVGDRPFEGVSDSVDHFCAADGKPINMVFLRNGTTFMNTVVEMLGSADGDNRSNAFEKVMPLLIEADADCGGVIALPFMDDEPGLGVSDGGQALIHGLNAENATAGNVAKAAILSTIFNLRLGSEVLDEQNFPRNEIVLSGGLTKTPELSQIVADVFRTPVRLLDSAEEGSAWGAALMAKFRHLAVKDGKSPADWTEFLTAHATSDVTTYQPDEESSQIYDKVFTRYRELLESVKS